MTFAQLYLLSSDSTSLLCFSSSNSTSLLCFSTLHIVGSFTSKLPLIIFVQPDFHQHKAQILMIARNSKTSTLNFDKLEIMLVIRLPSKNCLRAENSKLLDSELKRDNIIASDGMITGSFEFGGRCKICGPPLVGAPSPTVLDDAKVDTGVCQFQAYSLTFLGDTGGNFGGSRRRSSQSVINISD